MSESETPAERAAYLRGREDCMAHLRVVVAETLENAEGLARFGEGAAVEARCRAWAGYLLDEVAENCWLDDREREVTAELARFDALMAKARALIAEAERVEGETNT